MSATITAAGQWLLHLPPAVSACYALGVFCCVLIVAWRCVAYEFGEVND